MKKNNEKIDRENIKYLTDNQIDILFTRKLLLTVPQTDADYDHVIKLASLSSCGNELNEKSKTFLLKKIKELETRNICSRKDFIELINKEASLSAERNK